MLSAGGTNANKNWVSGEATIKYVSSDNPLGLAGNYRHKYLLTHTFVISPVYVEDYATNLEDNTQPDIFTGKKSLKYIANYEFRTVATDPNTAIQALDNQLIGEVGWYGENYNGNQSIYSVVVDSYKDTTTTDVVDSLQSTAKTTVYGTITGTGFTNTSKAGIYFNHCATLDQYSVNQGSFASAFLYDSIISTMAAGTVTTVGTGQIKRFKLMYTSATELTFEADILLTTAEATYVDGESYFLGIQLGDTNVTDSSNKVIEKVDYQPWTLNPDVTGLATFSKQGFLLHNQDSTEAGYKDYKGWKQDGALFKDTIVLNKTLQANLKALKFELIAYNTTTEDYFVLQDYQFNLNNVIAANTTPRSQAVDLNTTRNFKLATGDQFNAVTLMFNAVSGTTQDINVTIGFKFDWQSWVKNKNADTIFVDQTLDSNGLGNDVSRYSLSNGYVIKTRLEATIDQWETATSTYTSNSTKYVDLSPSLSLYDYGHDASTPANWSYLVQTFDSLGNNLSGAILTTEDTKMKITWTPLSGSTASFQNTWCIHRIESLNAVGYGDIDELSSIRESRIGNLLKPLSGQSYTKITDTGTTIVTESLIDYTKIKGINYNIFGRLGNVRIGGRYGYTGDFKFLNVGKTEAISFNYIGYPGESNSLRLCQLDTDYNVTSEQAIDIDNSWDWTHMRFAVDMTETSNGKAVFYAVYVGNNNDMGVSRFVYNGTTFIETQLMTQACTVNNPVSIKIDPALRPNSKAFLWVGMIDSRSAFSHDYKTLYWNGAAWVATNVDMYDAGIANTPSSPTDIAFDVLDVYIYNYDSGSTGSAQAYGKIGLWTQTGGSTTDPTDRSTFSNYTWSYDIIKNTTGHHEVNGIGSVGDIAGAWGMDIAEIDTNGNPVFVSRCNANNAVEGNRHLVRVRANIASPTTSAHWTIETPCAHLNGLGAGTTTMLSGTASATAHTGIPSYTNDQNIAVIDGNNFICGSTGFHWIKWTINSWTGASNNDWYINAPFDVTYDFTSGNTLTE
jgi:hypothetical protein